MPDAVPSVNKTAAHPNDLRRQTAEGVVPVCVWVCVCVCVCVRAYMCNYCTYERNIYSISGKCK